MVEEVEETFEDFPEDCDWELWSCEEDDDDWDWEDDEEEEEEDCEIVEERKSSYREICRISDDRFAEYYCSFDYELDEWSCMRWECYKEGGKWYCFRDFGYEEI